MKIRDIPNFLFIFYANLVISKYLFMFCSYDIMTGVNEMNKIDRDFYHLIDIIKHSSREQIFYQMKENFKLLSEETQRSLEDYFSKFAYWGKLDHQNGEYEEIENKVDSFVNHVEDYVWLYEKLHDYRSKKLLLAIMRNWYQYDFVTLRETMEDMFPDYFDLDVVSCDSNEVVVDLGAYTGDTIYSYLDMYGNDCYKKIYCYEITDDIYEFLKVNTEKHSNIECRKKAVSDCAGKLYIQKSNVDASANTVAESGENWIEAVTIDEDIKEPITLIKMDIEGFEQKALMGCKRHIVEDHPKLLLSVYHNHEDIWKIPRMIEEICPGYQFYLRNHGGPIFPTEITLLAIYKGKVE